LSEVRSRGEIHHLMLTKEVLTPERWDTLKALPTLRSLGRSSHGTYSTMAYLTGTSDAVSTDTTTACSGPTCLDYLVASVSRVIGCQVPADRYNVHALVQVEHEYLRAVVDSYLRFEDARAGVRTTAGLLYGSGPHQLVVEVVGRELGDVSSSLLDILGVRGVVVVDHHFFPAKDTHGWGGVGG
jgi:hypothetical protein